MPRPDRIMEKNNHHNHQNGGGNGFFLGVIVGVLLTLLFTTKRGREILKEVMEKGIQKFSNLEDLMREAEDEDLDEEGDDFIPAEPIAIPAPKNEPEKKHGETPAEPKPPTVKEIAKHPKEEAATPIHEEKPKAPRGKRWFRGLRKKS